MSDLMIVGGALYLICGFVFAVYASSDGEPRWWRVALLLIWFPRLLYLVFLDKDGL